MGCYLSGSRQRSKSEVQGQSQAGGALQYRLRHANQQQWLSWLIFDEGATMDVPMDVPMKVHGQQRQSGRPSDHIRGFGSDWF